MASTPFLFRLAATRTRPRAVESPRAATGRGNRRALEHRAARQEQHRQREHQRGNERDHGDLVGGHHAGCCVGTAAGNGLATPTNQRFPALLAKKYSAARCEHDNQRPAGAEFRPAGIPREPRTRLPRARRLARRGGAACTAEMV